MTATRLLPLGDAPTLDAIVAFMRDVGLDVAPEAVSGDGARLGRVGDLLHEACHPAVADPAGRSMLSDIGDDPAEEMAAIAWSCAAAKAIGVPVDTLFPADHTGGPDYLIAAFPSGAHIGLPMPHFRGTAARADDGEAGFPAMRAWLRPAVAA